jgi:hypothetical protein
VVKEGQAGSVVFYHAQKRLPAYVYDNYGTKFEDSQADHHLHAVFRLCDRLRGLNLRRIAGTSTHPGLRLHHESFSIESWSLIS